MRSRLAFVAVFLAGIALGALAEGTRSDSVAAEMVKGWRLCEQRVEVETERAAVAAQRADACEMLERR